jgi:hypothetical protein
MVFVLCASIISPVSWSGSQQQQVKLEYESEPESSKDDNLITGLFPDLIVNKLLSLIPILLETPPPAGSDAYPSITLHGPPAPDYPV